MDTQVLYGGAVTIRRDGSHKYFVTDTERGVADEWVPGVTGISGKVNMDGKLENLMGWAAREAAGRIERDWLTLAALSPDERSVAIEDAAKEAQRKRDKAAEVGTIVHKWVEGHIRAVTHFADTPEWPTDPVVIGGVERYLEWEAQHHVEYVSTERYVYHRTHMYAGQADIVARVNGGLSLVDIKTSNYFSGDYVLQTAAYTEAWNEEFTTSQIARRYILMIDNKEGKLDVKDLGGEDEQSVDFAGFLGCLAVRNWEHGLKDRKEAWGLSKKKRSR